MLIPIYQKREGTQAEKPAELDRTSSPSTVYLRKDIVQTTRTEEDGTEVIVWQYEEAEMTVEEFEEYEKLLIQAESPAITQLQQQISELQMSQEMATIDRELAEEEQMQNLSDIQLSLEEIKLYIEE